MKRYFLVSIVITAVFFAIVMAGSPGPVAGNSDSFSECNTRCAPLQGESRSRCFSTCVRTKKKNEPVGESDVKKKMRDCEERCASFNGVDRIRCIRICLDIKDEQGSLKKQQETVVENPDPCESRCAVLSGSLRDRCVARCKNNTKFEGGMKRQNGKK